MVNSTNRHHYPDSGPQRFDSLVKSLYYASAGIQSIDEFLIGAQRFYEADLLGCISANLIDGSTRFPFFHGVSDSDLRLYANYYADRNPMIAAALPRLVQGRVVQLSEVFTNAELSRMEFHVDYVRRIGADFQCGFVFRPKSDWVHPLLICRSRGARDFSQDEKASIQRLRGHVEAALAIESHVSQLAKAVSVNTKAIERLSFGVLYLSRSLEVLESNGLADQALEAGELLWLDGGVLSPGPKANRATRDLLRELHLGVLKHCKRVQIGRSATGKPQYLSVFAVEDAKELEWLGSKTTRHVAFFSFAGRPSENCRKFLRREYGLTERELEVATQIFLGKSLIQLSDDLNISHETSRSHLRQIFRKLGVNSQTQVALALERLNSFS